MAYETRDYWVFGLCPSSTLTTDGATGAKMFLQHETLQINPMHRGSWTWFVGSV
jgi:hypothetical protein